MGIHRLWLGEDHMLQVHARLGVERYRRFYFSDIQALITRKTAAGKVYNGALAVIASLLVLPGLELGGGWSVFFYCAAGLFLLFLLVNCLLGPTCKTHLRTAVQQEALPSLHRLKTARRVMNLLRPLIQAKQGNLSRERAVRGLPPERPVPNAPARSGRPLYRAAEPTMTASVSDGGTPLLLSVLLLLQVLVGTCEFYWNHVAIAVIDMAVFICLAIGAVVFLVRQYDPPRRTGMLTLAWSTVVYVGLRAASGYVIVTAVAFKDARAAFNQWHQLQQIARISPGDSIYLTGTQIFFIVFAALLAILILIGSRKRPVSAMSDPADPGRHTRSQTVGGG